MTQAPYTWQLTGSCPACGSPIYGRVLRPGDHWVPGTADLPDGPLAREQPEARRTCPMSCPHGKAAVSSEC